MDQFYFKKASFVKSVADIKDAPLDDLKDVLFVGKSNVGKSSLINALTNMKKLAFTSSNPGHTKLLNYFLIDNMFYLVDCPGYGYSSKRDYDYEFYGKLVENYFKDNKKLSLIIFLLDSRHEPTNDDLDFYQFLLSYNYHFVICMTKCDKLNMSMKSKITKNLKNKFGDAVLNNEIFLCSTNDKQSILLLKNYIETCVKEEN